MKFTFCSCCAGMSDADKYFEQMSTKLKPVVITVAPCKNAVAESVNQNLNELIKPVFKLALVDVIENQFNMTNYSTQINSFPGDSLLNEIIYIKITSDAKKTKDIVLKISSANEAQRTVFHSGCFFTREIQVHDKLMRIFEELQKSKGIDSEVNGFYQYAKCYKVLLDDPNHGLFMEDLTSNGFQPDKFEPDFEYAKVTMETLAKFHALSFALKDQCVSEFEPFTMLDDPFRKISDNKYFSSIMNQSIEVLDAKKHGLIIQKLNNMDPKKFLSHLLKCTDGRASPKYAVVCHGDLRHNNILFKRENNKLDIRFTDFQVARFASPVCDLLYYFFTCSSQSFRKKHYENLLHIYHKSLSDFLTKLGSDPNTVFPFSAMESELKRIGIFGYLMACMVLPFILEKSNDLGGGENCKENTNFKFGLQMRGILEDIHKYGYL